MPFRIIRNNITDVVADAIVNTANPRHVIGAGVDAAIHQKAGSQLLEARMKIGDIPIGHCAVTPAYHLSAKFVIHTVGPVWKGGTQGEKALLKSAYESALKAALDLNCQSVAFPLISAGTYGFPKKEALDLAIQVFNPFLMEHEMEIILVVWDQEAFLLSQSLFHNVQSFIEEHCIEEQQIRQESFLYQSSFDPRNRRERNRKISTPRELFHRIEEKSLPIAPQKSKSSKQSMAKEILPPMAAMSCTAPLSLDEMLANTDAGFSETLLKLIDQSGKKDAEIYKKANVSKQHFSKIRNNPDYKPTKATAIAFAIALELDLPQTKDLIGRAGYALTNSSKFDVIIMYFISQKNYNMFDINMTLFQFDQMTLGV